MWRFGLLSILGLTMFLVGCSNASGQQVLVPTVPLSGLIAPEHMETRSADPLTTPPAFTSTYTAASTTSTTPPTATRLPPTATRLPPTATPPGIVQTCFSIASGLPDQETVQGRIALRQGFPGDIYLSIDDLGTGKTIFTMPASFDIAVSPDRTMVAINSYEDQGLVILTAEGRRLITHVWQENIGRIERWLDNENIFIVAREPDALLPRNDKYPPDIKLLNPFTKQSQVFPPDFPEIDLVSGYSVWPWRSMTVYSPDLRRVVYPSSERGVVLYGLPEKRILASIGAFDWLYNPPIWSPDGSKFIFADKGEFYLVSIDGAASRLSRLDSKVRSKPNSWRHTLEFYSWSPDNRTVAFWFADSKTGRRTLALLDTITGQVVDTCVPAGYNDPFIVRTSPNPVWSPDGRRLLVAANYRPDEPYNDVLLVDLEQEAAYKIGEGNFPVGWLVSSENAIE